MTPGSGGSAGPAVLTLFDFSAESQPWPSIDDVVMGGRSSSAMEIEKGMAVFAGEVSLADGGGFASVRSLARPHDLSAYSGILLRVRGDGKRYGLRLRTDRRFDGVNYQAFFGTRPGICEEIRLPFEAFRPVLRGRTLQDWPELDRSAVQTFGLIIAGRQEGPFRLEIDWIRAYPGP